MWDHTPELCLLFYFFWVMPFKGAIPTDILTCVNLVEQMARLATHLICTLGFAWQGCSVMQEAAQKELAGNGCQALHCSASLCPWPHHNAHIYTQCNRVFQSQHKGMMLQTGWDFHKIEIHRLKPRRHRFPSLRLVIARKTWRKCLGLEEPLFFFFSFTG